MNRELGLKVLSQIMGWDDEEAREEFRWLAFMSAYKYDGYRDFLAGARFVEKLATWLQQFSQKDRRVAYRFVRENVIYFSPPEIQRLVEKCYPEVVQPRLIEKVASTLGIAQYQVWAHKKSVEEFQWERRKTLFMGLSDGARIDALRRANVGVIVNDQVVLSTEIFFKKWLGLLEDLREDLQRIRAVDTSKEKFSRVYLIDDFTASGTSLLRDPQRSGEFKGKLARFSESLANAIAGLDGNSPLESDCKLVVHHYIGTEQARLNIESAYAAAKDFFDEKSLKDISFSFGITLPSTIRITQESNDPFRQLCESYYDPKIEGKGKHGAQSGTTNKMFGYAGCGLPVVLEHNTPNNSLPLLWAETYGDRAMTPLFRRRERHSDVEDNSASQWSDEG